MALAEEEGGEWVVVETDLAPDVGRFSAGWRGEPGDGGVAASGDSFWGVAGGCDWGELCGWFRMAGRRRCWFGFDLVALCGGFRIRHSGWRRGRGRGGARGVEGGEGGAWVLVEPTRAGCGLYQRLAGGLWGEPGDGG